MENGILKSEKSGAITGRVNVPGDKSISHRALILASQAMGTTKITGLLESEDVLNTKECLEKLGISIVKEGEDYIVEAAGLGSLQEPIDVLDCGNSGTGCRLLMGLVASYDFASFFTGDDSLRSRPMSRIRKPLCEMGVDFESREEFRLPVMIRGKENMMPLEYEVPVPSAQVKSSVLLAGLNLPGITTVIEREKTRDHTELMMKYLGIPIEVTSDMESNTVINITGQVEYKARNIDVPGDPSSAAFLVVAAIVTEGSELIINEVLLNKTRTGLFDTLKEMGADLEIKNIRERAGEYIGDIKVRSSKLKAIEVPASRAPSMIDEYPILAIAAAQAEGITTMKGLKELRVKESDRLSSIAAGLRNCGIEVNIDGDDLIVNGGSIKGGNLINTHGDHRTAMSFLVAGLVSEDPIEVDNASMIATSFPEFQGLMNSIGAKIS